MGRETDSRFAGAGECAISAPRDAVIARIAARQKGLILIEQLRAIGLSEKAIRHRLRTGRLVRVHAGVYRVGPVVDPLAEPLAAVLACGSTAALSHQAALHLHRLTKASPRTIDVTVTSGHPRPRGVVVHRAALAADERTVTEGIPVTTAARVIVDVATSVPRRELERLVEQAIVLQAATEPELRAAAERPRRGAARLNAVLAELSDPALTRSEAERRLVDLVRSSALPAPVTNTRIGRHEVDAYWPRHGVVVEVDGYAFHGTRQAFERDRRKDRELLLRGLRVLRFTWRQLTDEPHAVVTTLAVALSRGSGS